MIRLLCLLGAAALWLGQPAAAQDVDFGDDTSEYANDGECDDPRFEGPGMTSTPLLDADIGHDATDCGAAFAAGTIALRPGTEAAQGSIVIDGVDFGDDTSQYANDGECDDPRFAGAGMTTTTLLEADRGRDASDCAAAWRAGTIALADETAPSEPLVVDGIDFGDDSGNYANDGECDDPRFEGPGTATTLLEADRGRDASDCAAAWRAGTIALATETGPSEPIILDGIDFGDDSGSYPMDGECDDPRFIGAAMAAALDNANILRDASDCSAAYLDGRVMPAGGGTIGQDEGDVDYAEPAFAAEPPGVPADERARRRANR